MSKFIPTITISLFFVLFSPFFSSAQENELGIYERLDEYLPDDLHFVNENYDTVNLLSIIDKPTVVVLVYYECPGLCSPLLEGVAEVITKSDLDLGKDYQVFTISFEAREKPKLAREKKTTYSRLVKGKNVDEGWTFFTGDSINIKRLLDSFGYKIKRQGAEIIHPGALMVLSPDGKITRYLHGTYFLPFDLKMAIVEASQGRSGPTINKVLKYCFTYDAEGKKYVFNVTKISGTLILLAALIFLGTLVIKSKKKKNLTNQQPTDVNNDQS